MKDCRDCEKPAVARGFCPSHYTMARRRGEFQTRPYVRGVRPAQNGYLRVWAPNHPTASRDGYALQHRLIAYDAGLLSDLRHEVHHVNRVRDDNRLENLRVLTPEEHQDEHRYEVGRLVRNQYGVFPVLTPEERIEKNRARCRENARKRREALRAERDAA